MSYKHKKRLLKALIVLFIVIVCIVCLFPFVWMVMVSFRTKADVINPTSIFVKPTLENYVTVIKQNNILKFFKNSLVVSVFTTIISLLFGTLAAYGFARFNWEKRENRAFFALSQRFLPAMAVVIPYFLMASLVHLLDTPLVLIICYTTFNIPFTIWMMRGFIEDLPIELEEAAWVDGCSRFKAFFKVMLPLLAPGLVATAIFCVINSWNEFVFANFLTSFSAKTIPTSIMMYLTITGVKWGELAATGVLSVLPVLIFASIVQKYMIRGLTFGSVKG